MSVQTKAARVLEAIENNSTVLLFEVFRQGHARLLVSPWTIPTTNPALQTAADGIADGIEWARFDVRGEVVAAVWFHDEGGQWLHWVRDGTDVWANSEEEARKEADEILQKDGWTLADHKPKLRPWKKVKSEKGFTWWERQDEKGESIAQVAPKPDGGWQYQTWDADHKKVHSGNNHTAKESRQELDALLPQLGWELQ